MAINDIIMHPHISHNDNYLMINPTVYRANLLGFLNGCLGGSTSTPTPGSCSSASSCSSGSGLLSKQHQYQHQHQHHQRNHMFTPPPPATPLSDILSYSSSTSPSDETDEVIHENSTTSTPKITLSSIPYIDAGDVVGEQDRRFLRLPRVVVGSRVGGRVGRGESGGRVCEGNAKCGCRRCGGKRSGRSAELKGRRKRIFVRGGGGCDGGEDEGERSEIEV